MHFVVTLIISLIFCVNINAQTLNASYETLEQLPNSFKNRAISTDVSYNIKEDMNPFYLEADFNGQGELDVAICILEPTTNKQGILIQHGEDHSYHILAAGQTFNKRDNLDWIDVWKVYRKRTADQTIFADNFDIEGSETVKLENIAIQVAPSEGSYNLITWDGTKYIWIHTGE
jgi:hypothetical protein